MSEFSKEAFFRFLDYAAEKNLVKSKTASSWRSASSKLMEDLSDVENADVRKVHRGQKPHKASMTQAPSDKPEKESAYIASDLTLSYPLRSDFLAQVVIPRDLTTTEAKRLGAFLLTTAIDYQPE
jgi:hypothetical protein